MIAILPKELYIPIGILFIASWIGGAIPFLFRSQREKRAKLFLALSGAFLFGLVLTRFFPDLFQKAGPSIGIWVLGGFLIQSLLEPLSQGIEHGHAQRDASRGSATPYALLIGLSVHALLESVPLGVGYLVHKEELLLGLAVHKLPVSLALAGLLLNAGKSPKKALLPFAIFTIMAPLGVMIGVFVPQLFQELPDAFPHYVLALVIGIILHVSTTILFESTEDHRFDLLKMIAVLGGFALAIALA